VRQQLPADAWAALCRATAVVSSLRLREVAQDSGFERCVLARSALPGDLIQAAATLD
jgi:uroporphyrinogen-III synthase